MCLKDGFDVFTIEMIKQTSVFLVYRHQFKEKLKFAEYRKQCPVTSKFMPLAPGLLSDLKYKSIPLLQHDYMNPSWAADILWKTTLLFKVPRPSWLGPMQAIYKGHLNYPGKSEIMLMPMIDIDPNDLSCIYSTLKFFSAQSRQQGCTAVLTFDQPLFWKASRIVDSESATDSDIGSVVIRLGGLHQQMSFLGCIGHLMGSSGLQDFLSLIYAKNTVPHMLTGKAISRAIRGHILTSSALHTLLLSSALNVPLQSLDQ